MIVIYIWIIVSIFTFQVFVCVFKTNIFATVGHKWIGSNHQLNKKYFEGNETHSFKFSFSHPVIDQQATRRQDFSLSHLHVFYAECFKFDSLYSRFQFYKQFIHFQLQGNEVELFVHTCN